MSSKKRSQTSPLCGGKAAKQSKGNSDETKNKTKTKTKAPPTIVTTQAKKNQNYQNALKLASAAKLLDISLDPTVIEIKNKGIEFKIWTGLTEEINEEENEYDRFAGEREYTASFAGFVTKKINETHIGTDLKADRGAACVVSSCKGRMFGDPDSDCNHDGENAFDRFGIDQIYAASIQSKVCDDFICEENGRWSLCTKGHIYGDVCVTATLVGHCGWEFNWFFAIDFKAKVNAEAHAVHTGILHVVVFYNL